MPDSIPLTPGIRVLCRDAEWLVTRVDSADHSNKHSAVHCVGVDDLVRGHEAIFLTQLDTVQPVDPRKTRLIEDASNGYRLSKLFLEAQVRQMPATGIDPDYDGMGAFDLMPFQAETVRRALYQLRPRLLLADTVGLGKTIQVGMILTELLRRGRADRILVLAKKSMLTQFQAEMWNRFAIPLVRLDSAGIARLRLRIPANKNPFEVYHRVIISIDTLKNVARYEHFLKDTRWDVVIIDEAHNVAGASVPERHLSYRLARLLARRTDSMLLTTATPHNGRPETFGRLISLLDPSAIPDPSLKKYTADDIKDFFLMRFKEDVRQEITSMLAERKVVPLEESTADATEEEEKAYEVLAELRESAILKDDSDSARSSWQSGSLVQYGLYKLFLSSPEACLRTVNKRLAQLQKEDPESPEVFLVEKLKSVLRKLSLAGTTRYRLLLKQLKEIGWDGSPGSPRVLIFTEYRGTQDALAAALAAEFHVSHSSKFEDQPRQTIALINGSCPDVHLMKTVEAFATRSSPVRMLVATDVASEGINLHHQCHHIIHYDLPWSIITLIQRNGRIDRLGQEHSPVLRYLMVNTQQGLLKGDRSIFERLIEKIEEINRLRVSGESILRLYDQEAEERYIASRGVLPGNVAVFDKPAAEVREASDFESILEDAKLKSNEDYAALFLGQSEESGGAPESKELFKRHRLYSDKDFFLEGYRHLAEQNRDYASIQQNGKLMLLAAPEDLRRRLGASDERGSVIQGSTAIPEEAWPESGEFRLTDEPAQVELAIKAARNTSGYWSGELLCCEQHPILQWIVERLVMQVPRGKAPIVLSRTLDPGELCFCLVGQVSSRAGKPLVVDAHAISFKKGGGFQHRSLEEALNAAGFDRLVNTGESPNFEAAQLLVPAAIEASIEHMKRLRLEFTNKMIGPLRREERRLHRWQTRRKELLEEQIGLLGENHPRARRYRRDLEEMQDYIKDREKNWREAHFEAASEPSTQLVLVIEGVGKQ